MSDAARVKQMWFQLRVLMASTYSVDQVSRLRVVSSREGHEAGRPFLGEGVLRAKRSSRLEVCGFDFFGPSGIAVVVVGC